MKTTRGEVQRHELVTRAKVKKLGRFWWYCSKLLESDRTEIIIHWILDLKFDFFEKNEKSGGGGDM
jgi:hypothetical protein